MRHFGLGFVAAVPAGANPTPIPFALVRGLSYDHARKFVKERGAWKHVVAVGEADNDITGKFDNVDIMSGTIAQLTGGTIATGSKIGVPSEVGTIPTTPFQVTASQGATFDTDYGVYDNTSGLVMTRVAAGPTTGQYSVNTATGVFTFAAADVGHKVGITYSYLAAAAGKTVSVVNTPMGLATGYVVVGYSPSQTGKSLGVKLYNCFIPKLSLGWAPDAFTKQGMEFFAAQDSGSTAIADIYVGE